MSDKKDIHNLKKDFARSLAKLENSTSVIECNRDLILRFIRDCRLGKTLKNRQKKTIGEARCLKYIFILVKLSNWLNKPFKDVNQNDMERLIENLENDKYTYRLKSKNGQVRDAKTLAHSTKVDYKKTLKKFYKWLLGDNKFYPEIVDWIETYDVIKEIPALKRNEVEKLANSLRIRDKAIVMTLFDSGARAEEFLNIRFQDIEKQDGVYKIRIVHSKTKPRTIHLPIATKYLDLWIEENDNKNNGDYLFNITYEGLRMMLHRVGKKILKKSVYPHLMRHSSASYYANLLNHQQLCYRFGWAMSSDMPNRYIDREGIYEKEAVSAVQMNDMSRIEMQNQKLNEELFQLKQKNEYLNNNFEKLQTKLNNLLEGRGFVELIVNMQKKQESMAKQLQEISGQKFDLVFES